MFGIDRRLLQNFDWALLALIAILLTMGIVNLNSATHAVSGLAEEVRRQLLAIAVGGVAFLVTVAIDYRHYERLALPLFGRLPGAAGGDADLRSGHARKPELAVRRAPPALGVRQARPDLRAVALLPPQPAGRDRAACAIWRARR